MHLSSAATATRGLIVTVSFVLAAASFAYAVESTPAQKGSTPAPPAAKSACQIGAHVTDRQKRSGVVIEAKGADCRVKLDDGAVRYYLAWMLEPAGEAATPGAGAGGLTIGRYQCSAAGGIAGTLQLVIKSDSQYADRNGKTGTYAHDPKTGKIRFESGAWAGSYGEKLGPSKIGIASRPGGYYGTTCDLK